MTCRLYLKQLQHLLWCSGNSVAFAGMEMMKGPARSGNGSESLYRMFLKI